jgi:tripartite-type tricarboxylate transporter receptor subunit TctC
MNYVQCIASCICLIWTFSTTAASAQARPWPAERPVTLIVPYAAGGSVDAMARALGQGITSKFRQSVIVENVGGAEGYIGTRRVIEAKPDGYTLLVQVPALTILNQLPVVKEQPDPLSQLAPVTSIAASPVLLVGSAKIPPINFAEFVNYCKTAIKPCSTGSGESLGRLRAQQIASEAGIPNLINVPYRGTNLAITDLISGNIQLTFVNLPNALPHQKSGNVRILAVQDTKRSPLLPDVPTTAESGFPQFQMISWFGLFAPKNTAAEVLQQISEALGSLKNQEDLQRAVATAGATLVLNSPLEFAQEVEKEANIWNALARRYPLN